MPSKVTNRPPTAAKLPSGAVAVREPPSMPRLHAHPRHRRRRLHRLQPRRRPGRARRRGHRARRPLHRPAREPRRRARAAAPSWPSSTSATPRPCAELVERVAARGHLPPGRPDRRAQVGRRPGRRRAHQRGGHDQRARAPPARRRRAAWSTPPPAAPSTARARSSPRPRTTRSRPRRPTACRSSAPRATASCSPACTGSRPSSLRYGNVYGPRQDPLGEAGVIAIFCGKLLEGGTADGVRRRPPDPRLRATSATS